MSTLLKAAGGLALLAALIAAIGPDEIRAATAGASLPGLAAFAAASLAVFVTYAARWRIVLVALGERPPPFAALLLCRSAAHAASVVVPSAQLAGEPVRVALLRRRGLDWEGALLSVGIDRLLEITAGAVMGPLYVAVFLASTGHGAGIVAGAAATAVAGLAGMTALWMNAAWSGRATAWLARRRWLPSLERVGERVAAFVRSRRFAAALGLSFLVEGLLLVEIRALASAFGFELSWPTAGAALVGIGISAMAPVPGSIGSLEAVQVGVVRLSGGTAGLGLALGLAVRLRETLWTTVGAAYLWAQGVDVLASVTSGKTEAIEAKDSAARRR